jgi:hypothetical protein
MQKLNYTLTIFVGDIDESLSVSAKSYDSSAWLLDYSNYKEFLTLTLTTNTTVYTSLADLPKNLEIFYNILRLADKIVYCPPDHWSDNKIVDFVNPGESIQGLTEIFLLLISDSIQVDNLNTKIVDPIVLVDQRKSAQSQLWIAGCSISHGDGVEPHERYGQLIADELNIACSFLTLSGSAIDWAADQILRSDIRENDIVVWGLTSPERLTYVYNSELLSITPLDYLKFPQIKNIIDPSDLFSQNTLYHHFYSIQQVVNYCNKCRANLILVGLLSGCYSFLSFLQSQKNYVHIPYSLKFKDSFFSIQLLDLGNDNAHPGPKQHQQYKQHILNKINQLQAT